MQRFDTLDALRGVAAIWIVLFHLYAQVPGIAVPHGYLAVDFFFELSGFVIAYTYKDRMAAGMDVFRFLMKRMIRIYPLALLGLGFGVGTLLILHFKQTANSMGLLHIVVSTLCNLLFIPDVMHDAASDNRLFPSNSVIWSLFFEMAVNIAWAAVLWRLKDASLLIVAVVSGIALGALTLAHGNGDLGSSFPTFMGGFTRVAFGFTVGVIVERRGWRIPHPERRWWPALLGLVLSLGFVMPAVGQTWTPLWDIFCVAALFPAIIMAGLSRREGGRVSVVLGAVSYPLYAIHFPLLFIPRLIWPAASTHVGATVFEITTCAALVSVSYVVLWFYDEPIRTGINTLRGRSRALNGLACAPRALS